MEPLPCRYPISVLNWIDLGFLKKKNLSFLSCTHPEDHWEGCPAVTETGVNLEECTCYEEFPDDILEYSEEGFIIEKWGDLFYILKLSPLTWTRGKDFFVKDLCSAEVPGEYLCYKMPDL